MKLEQEIRLDQLQPHQCGIVTRIEAPDDEMERLMAMGVCTGRTVELVLKGDPLILQVYGSRLGVSARLARRVLVDPCASMTCPLPTDVQPGQDTG